MSSDELQLRTAWNRHLGADGWFDRLVARHREPHRHHHDLRHVRWVVHHVRELAATAVEPPLDARRVDLVVAAAFFHDAVYDPRRTDNEEASARIARVALGELGWPVADIDPVAAMIEATASHQSNDPAADPATDVLLAADLGVLAAPPTGYADYTRAIRREYAHLGDDEWRTGRSSFVAAMLGRSHIFPERLALETWERRARANLTAELASLS